MTRIIPAILLFTFFSCKQVHQPVEHNNESDPFSDALVKANKAKVEQHQVIIKEFVENNGINAQVKQSGLWYEIIKGNSPEVSITTGMQVSYTYSVFFLNGELCYSAKENTIEVGKGGVESGVEEGLLLLHKGDSARFIIPPHLAHGLTGDDNKIPGNTILDLRLRIHP